MELRSMHGQPPRQQRKPRTGEREVAATPSTGRRPDCASAKAQGAWASIQALAVRLVW